MNRFRTYLAGISIAGGVTLLSASLIDAKDKRPVPTPQEANCELALNRCRESCSMYQDPQMVKHCLRRCDIQFVSCMAPPAARPDPVRVPQKIPTTPIPNAGNTQKSTSAASATPNASSASPKPSGKRDGAVREPINSRNKKAEQRKDDKD